MPIWELKNNVEDFLMLRLVNEKKHWKTLTYGLNGTALQATWETLEVCIDHYTETGGDIADFPSLVGAGLVTTSESFAVIEHIVQDHVELLPIICEDGIYDELCIVNVLSILDCLDHNQSKVSYFRDGRTMWVDQHVFDMECMGDTPIFKTPEHHGRIFVNDLFKQVVEASGLRGLIFWPSYLRYEGKISK